MSSSVAQLHSFRNAINSMIDVHGGQLVQKFEQAANPILQWLSHLSQHEKTGTADELLDGLHKMLIEAAGLTAIGLKRPALYAQRAQIDVAFGWLYFKDHPVEWSRVVSHADGFMLKRDVLKYLEEKLPGFKTRFEALRACSKPTPNFDPYRVLSAHVHLQSSVVVPKNDKFVSLVASFEECCEVIDLQLTISEYVSDLFLSYYATKWASLPPSIVNDANSRLGQKSKAVFS